MTNLIFCAFPETAQDPYVEISVDYRCQLDSDGYPQVQLKMSIPVGSLLIHDEDAEVFGEFLHPYWGVPRGNSIRIKTLTVTVPLNDPADLEARILDTFWETVVKAKETLFAYFDKQVSVLCTIEGLNR